MSTAISFQEHKFQCEIVQKLQEPTHLHPQVEVLFLLEGKLTGTYGHESFSMQSGEFLLLFPLVTHSFHCEEEIRGLHCVLDKHLLSQFSHTFTQLTPKTLPLLSSDLFHDEFHFCLEQLVQREELQGETTRTYAYLSILLENFIENFSFIEKESDSNADWIYKLLDFIQENFTEEMNLTLVSAKLNLSKYHISRIFKEKIGSSFLEYVNNLRVEKAKTLLTETLTPITEVAYACGFDSLSSFFRVFKQFEGMTPKEFQKNQKMT